MKKWLLLLAGLVSAGQLAAQEGVEITTRQNPDNTVDFIAAKHTPGTYAVQLKFDNVKNTEVPASVVVNVRHGGVFYTLRPRRARKPVSYTYRSSWIRGAVDPAADTAFVYRLPYGEGLSRRAVKRDDAGRLLYPHEPILGFHAWVFTMEPGDTVYAMRKGIVLEAVDRYDPVTEAGTPSDGLDRPSNYVTVEHADGTTARYALLERGSIAVKPGETVYPDTPLGRAGTQHGVFVTLRYLESVEPNPIYPGLFAMQAFIDPVFATSQGNMRLTDGACPTSVAGQELIRAEMARPAGQQAKSRKCCRR